VSDVHGVAAACEEVLELGLDESVALHRRAARATRAGVRAMGLDLWPAREEIAASCVTAVAAPEGVDTLRLLAHVRERYGVMLSPGYGELKERVVRLGHMGPAARSLNPVIALGALGRGLADLGVAVAIGEGVEAALAVLAEPAAAGARR
jgi:pyridoxamine--pyruvate transaminase